MNKTAFIIAVAALLCSCGKGDDKSSRKTHEVENDGYVHYTLGGESSEDIANPERGYYMPFIFHHAGSPASVNDIRKQRESRRTLVLLEYYLTDFINSDISQDYLDMIGACFENVRKAGAKSIVRFAYSESESQKPWDASEERTLSHIAQLKPLLQANADVILVLQAGFVGVWGEWYYTENFVMSPASEADYQPRRRVIEALLDALPETRQVAVRTPAFKMKMFGLGLKDTLTRATAHDGSALSRIAGHNDCFVASVDDYGTYSSSSDRNFWKADTRYTIMGGETCDASSPYCKCDKSIPEMERYHWTYLNCDYNKSVLNVWKEGGCFDEAGMRLGYRIFVTDVAVEEKAKAGTPFQVRIGLFNGGFAPIQNPRDAYLVFEQTGGGVLTLKLEDDPRFWLDGQDSEISREITLETAGEYTMYLYLPDPEPALKDNPLYAVRLANRIGWDDSRGYNKLAAFTIE